MIVFASTGKLAFKSTKRPDMFEDFPANQLEGFTQRVALLPQISLSR